MKIYIVVLLLISALTLWGQETDYLNASQKMIAATDQKVTLGGYAQIDYNQPLSSDISQNGKLDVHRLVLLFGYNFSDKTQFITELELEHVVEVYVEQAWLNHRINNWLNFRGGLMLVPMGIVNEYHEPPSYNGVERPNVDKYIVPTTWREIGAGFNGYLSGAGLSYQLYLMNGFNGYNGSAKFNGANGLRSGRQKGAESYISAPNLSFKANYNSIPGLNLGLSGYFGKSQSTLYNGIAKNDAAGLARADSSVIGMSMLGIDGRYHLGPLQLKAQYILASLSNTVAYNAFTGSDVGSGLLGWYLEGAWKMNLNTENELSLTPFVRFEQYDTHHSVSANTIKNDSYNRHDITFGTSLGLNNGAVLKADYQLFGNASNSERKGQLNLGIGIWF